MVPPQVSIDKGAAERGKLAQHLQDLEAEVSLLQQLNHPNIVRYLVGVGWVGIWLCQRQRGGGMSSARLLAHPALQYSVAGPRQQPGIWARPMGNTSPPRLQGTERGEAALHIFLEYVPGGSIASLLAKFGESVHLCGKGQQAGHAECAA